MQGHAKVVYLLKSPPWILKGTVSLGERSDTGNGVALHEVLDDTMELGALVAESRLTNGQGPKVLGGLGDGLSLEKNGQIPHKC